MEKTHTTLVAQDESRLKLMCSARMVDNSGTTCNLGSRRRRTLIVKYHGKLTVEGRWVGDRGRQGERRRYSYWKNPCVYPPSRVRPEA